MLILPVLSASHTVCDQIMQLVYFFVGVLTSVVTYDPTTGKTLFTLGLNDSFLGLIDRLFPPSENSECSP